jgi:hypothetical protein
VRGFSALSVFTTRNLAPSSTSQAQPDPNCVVAAVPSSFLSASRLPNVESTRVFSAWRREAAASWTQTAPIERMVPGLCRIVEDRSVLGFARRGKHDLLERQVSIWRAGNELVQGVDISLVVLTVVEPKRPRRDDGSSASSA